MPYAMEYKVSNLDEHGKRTRILIPVEELPLLDRGIDHLGSYKSYQGVYRAWNEALSLKHKYNDKHQELIQELEKLIVEKMQEHLPLFSEYESARSPSIQSYFHSDGFVNVIIIEKKGLLKDPNLKVDYRREFILVEGESDDEGHWWSLVRWRNALLRSRSPLTTQDQENLRQILIEIESNPKIDQTIGELFKLDQEIYKELHRFKGELKAIVDKINHKEGNYILQGKCELGY
jgi:hypothetical protein